MHGTASRPTSGRHRKETSSRGVKKSIAFAALSVGSISAAGIGGATAAGAPPHLTASPISTGEEVQYGLANRLAHTSSIPVDDAPQILAISEYKPMTDINEQLDTVMEYNSRHLSSTLGPTVVKPAEGTYTSGFEMRWGSFHAGVDIANAAGTPIVAAMDGIVIDSGPASGFGQWIRLQHEDGTITVYGHMQTLDVGVGDHVRAGEKIAGMGSLGFSTGDHLHFEVYPAGSAAIDPVPWLAERGIVL